MLNRGKCLSLILVFFLTSLGVAQENSVAFDSDKWQIVDAEITQHLGRTSLQGTAILKDVEFENGIIELDIAVKHTRTYPGIVFRMQSDANYERFYIRPHRAPFYPDALQYTPTINKVAGWQLYNGKGYTAATEIPTEQWVHLKVEIKGKQARVFWNDMEKPALVIDDLKHGISKGTIGVLGPKDGSAFFSNFKYSLTDDLIFDPPPAVETPKGMIMDWEISKYFPAGRIDIELIPYPRFYSIFAAEWEKVIPEPSGLVNVSRYREWTGKEPECIFARTIVQVDKPQNIRLNIGYSDEITVFLNGKKLFYGMSAYRFRDPSFLGVAGLFDAVFLPLEKGRNEIFFLVKESFGGWGFMAKSDRILKPPIRDHSRLTKAWETEKVFLTPESVLFDPKRDVLYVTNFDNTANLREKDPTKYTGYISKVSLEGDVIEQKWITGLHAPTGMTIYNDKLYTTERRNLTEIDIQSGKILNQFPIPNPDFPNDLTVSEDGDFYITDTSPSDNFASRIYRYKDGAFDIWQQGIEVFRPNGAHIHENKLYFGGNPGDGNFKCIDLKTGRMQKIASLGAGVIDGIRPDGEGNFFVSHWEGLLYHVTSDGNVIELMNATGQFNTADFEYIPEKQLFIFPTFVDNRLIAFRLK